MHSSTHTSESIILSFFLNAARHFLSHLYWNLIQTTHLLEAVSDLKEDSCTMAAAVVLKTAKEGKKANFPQILWWYWPDHKQLQGQVFFLIAWRHWQKKNTAWRLTFPQLCMKESLETVWGKMRAVTVRNDPSIRNLLSVCQGTQTGNHVIGNRLLVT